jgi:hypothetical protein
MFVQLFIGAAVIMVTTLVAGAGFVLLERLLLRWHDWLLQPPHGAKMVLLLCGAVLWFLMIVTIAVWIWAGTFLALGIFVTVEAAVYFSIVSYTTLGFGDILLPHDWRLLAGMAAINGLLMIGLQTAILLEVLRQVRVIQGKHRDWIK